VGAAHTTLARRGIAVIDAETDIARPAEQVFDYASDPAYEPEWNVRMTRVERLTGGPVGVSARYRMHFTQGPPALSECVRFQRPESWQLAGRSKILTSSLYGQVTPAGDGAHLLLRMQIQPWGLLRLASPALRRRMQRELGRDIAAIKQRLEGMQQACAALSAD
jgi:uncharacterized protein YndB with AHSA1/START domain